MKKHFFLELNVLFFGKSDGPLRALVKPHKMMGQKRLQFLSGLVRPVSVLTCAIEINRHFEMFSKSLIRLRDQKDVTNVLMSKKSKFY